METISLSKGRVRITEGDQVRIVIFQWPRGAAFWIALTAILGLCLIAAQVSFRELSGAREVDWGYLLHEWGLPILMSWMIFMRQETIIVTRDRFSIRFSQWAWWHRYSLSSIARLDLTGFAKKPQAGHFRIPTLSFDYGYKMVLFGYNLSSEDAGQILTLIKERFGQYMKPDGAQ